MEKALGPAHRYSIQTAVAHYVCLTQRNRFKEAIDLVETCYQHALSSLGEQDQLTLEIATSFGSVPHSAGDFEASLKALSDLRQTCERINLPRDNFIWTAIEYKTGQSQLTSFRIQEAILNLERTREFGLNRRPSEPVDLELGCFLLEAYLLTGQNDTARALAYQMHETLSHPNWDVSKLKGNIRIIRIKFLTLQTALLESNVALSQLNSLKEEAAQIGETARRSIRRIQCFVGHLKTKAKHYDSALEEFDAAIVTSRAIDIAPWLRLNIQCDKAWTYFLAGRYDDARELLNATLAEYTELSTTDASIEEHPHYRLAVFYQKVIRDLETGCAVPSEDVLAEVEMLAVHLRHSSPLLQDKLAEYAKQGAQATE